MRGKTHTAGGLATGLAIDLACQHTIFGCFSTATAPSLAIQAGIIAFAVLGSLMPDIDIPDSTIGSKVKPLSKLINRTFGHRTLFHSPLLYAVIFLLTFKLHLLFAAAFALGAASHMLIDMLNTKGIPLLYPWKKTMHIANFESNSVADLVCRIILLILSVILLIALIYNNYISIGYIHNDTFFGFLTTLKSLILGVN